MAAGRLGEASAPFPFALLCRVPVSNQNLCGALLSPAAHASCLPTSGCHITIKEITERCGYPEQCYLSGLFKKSQA